MSKTLKWEYITHEKYILVSSNSKNSIHHYFCLLHHHCHSHISWLTICIHYYYYTFTHYRWPLLIMMIITFLLCHWSIAMSSQISIFVHAHMYRYIYIYIRSKHQTLKFIDFFLHLAIPYTFVSFLRFGFSYVKCCIIAYRYLPIKFKMEHKIYTS